MTEPQTTPTTQVVSVPNRPDERVLTVVSLPGGRFGYRCSACGHRSAAYYTREGAEADAPKHECPQEEW
jgi:hypothetical protein